MFQSRFHRWSCIIFLVILSSYSTSTTNTTTQDVTVNSSSVTVVGSTIITNTTSGSTTALPVVTNTSIMTTEPSFTNITTGSTSKITTTGDYSTTAAPGDNSTLPKYVGYICAAAAVLLYGSNFAPVKKFETGDGKKAHCYIFYAQIHNVCIFKLFTIVPIFLNSKLRSLFNKCVCHLFLIFSSNFRNVLSVDFVWWCSLGWNHCTGDPRHKALLPTGNDRWFSVGNR